MASLGDISFRLRGNTDGFTSAMKGAARSIDTLQRDILQLNADFKAGRIHVDAYRQSMAALNDQAKAIRTGVGQIAFQDIGRLNTVLKQTAPSVDKVGLSLRSLRGPLATMAAQTVGLNGSLGSLGSMLLTLGVGGSVGVIAIAGIAAIAFGMKKLMGATSDARKEFDDYVASLQKNGALAKVGNALSEQEEKVKKLTFQLQQAIKVDPLSMYAQNLRESLGEAVTELGRMQRMERQVFEGTKAGAREATKATNEWKSATMDVNEAIKSLTATYNTWRASLDRPILFTKSSVLGTSKDKDNSKETRDGIVKGVEDAAKELDGDKLLPPNMQEKVREQAKKLGTSIARSISQGIVDGNIGSVLKNLFKSILADILTSVIKKFAIQFAMNLIPGGAGVGGILKGIGGIFGLSRAAEGVVTPGVPSVSLTVPPNPSPVTMARDAQWLGMLSEGLRGLESTNGIRFQVVR